MNNRKLLAVYNTCGVSGDKTDWYIKSIETLIDQDLDGTEVVLSSCRNSTRCIEQVYKKFGNKISYFLTPQLYTVNITFNKAVQESVKYFGEFDGYMYIDSGCIMDEQKDIFRSAHKTMVDNDYGIVVVQTDTDECLENLGPPYVYESREIQVKDEHLVVPIGVSVNQHTAVFNNKIFKQYNKLYPDIFAAFCSESVLNYIASSVDMRWAIMADRQVRHLKAVDGPSSGFQHRVEAKDKTGQMVKNNPWNNLLYGRDAYDMINSKEAYLAGLGYEECAGIMPHNPEAYDQDGRCKDSRRLSETIRKYLFLSKEELDYDTIECRYIGGKLNG